MMMRARASAWRAVECGRYSTGIAPAGRRCHCDASSAEGAVLMSLTEGGGGIAAARGGIAAARGGIAGAALSVPLSVSPSLSVSVSVLLVLPPPTLLSASGAVAALPGGGNGIELDVSVVGGMALGGSGPGITYVGTPVFSSTA